MKSLVLRKLLLPRIWGRIARERLTEPLHLNLVSLCVAAFGTYRAKVSHDVIVRPHNAYSILRCAEMAKKLNIKTVTLAEFGVAAGAGLLNMAKIAARTTKATGVAFKIYGFDTGKGMPAPCDYRDHPDLYGESDYAMDRARLEAVLPPNVQLRIGNVVDTVAEFAAGLSPEEPLGYVVFDVDYYSSTRDALRVLTAEDPAKYLPLMITFFDDIDHDRHNDWCGELLAISEFNQQQPMRKLQHPAFLPSQRLYNRAPWLQHVYFAHILDHPGRNRGAWTAPRRLDNPYL